MEAFPGWLTATGSSRVACIRRQPAAGNASRRRLSAVASARRGVNEHANSGTSDRRAHVVVVVERPWSWCIDHPDVAALLLASAGSVLLAVFASVVPIDSALVFVLCFAGLMGVYQLHSHSGRQVHLNYGLVANVKNADPGGPSAKRSPMRSAHSWELNCAVSNSMS